jgi:hypothetical protein
MSYTVGSTRVINATSASGTTDFTFTFPYIKEAHIEVYLNYNKINQGTGSTEYQVITNVSPKLVRLNTGTASANLRVEIRRNSSLDTPLVDYADGSTLTANDLDTSALQSLYIDQELKDSQFQTVTTSESTGLPSLGNKRLTEVADPTSAQDAATKNYIDTFTGNIDGRDLSVDGAKLDGIEANATADQTNAEIRAAVEAASDSNVFTDADHTKLNEAATLTGSETLTNKTLTSPVINDMSGTAVVTSGTSTSDTKTYSAKRAGEIFYGKDTLSEIQSGETWSAADDKIATTSAIDARITDLVDDVGGFVPIANETSFPAANPDVNNGAGTLVSIKEFASSHTPSSGTVTIANGAGSGNTVTITGCGSTVLGAGYGGIVETTSTLHTYTFHRLSPKATEVTTVAGNITNINSCANNETNINAAVSNASNINSAVSNASNINAVVSNATNINTVAGNNTNINTVAGANSNITTVSTNISNVNSVGGSISNVNTVASNLASVNNFADQYRIASSDPTSSLNTGDLVFNTTANELRVYNGSSWQGGVTATGNLVSKADIGASSGVPGSGSAGQYLQTNGSGTLTWKTISTVITETDQTISSSLTITTGKNAMSVGDVTLASGVILTIPVNSKYILVG